MEQHPLSAAFPVMPEREFKDLAADIEIHGQREPCIIFEGMVLDGWHRYRACLETGREPVCREFAGTDPRAFVLSLNLNRRHLTASQRGAAAVAVSEWKPRGRPAQENSAPSAEMLAARADVSTRTIEHVKTAQRAGLGPAVRDGRVSAKRAAEISKLPPEERDHALEHRMPAPKVDEDSRLDDIAADFEAMSRIVEADDKLAAAWDEVRALSAKYEQLEQMYQAKCAELAAMTKEAKRWRKKAEAK